jgi:phosphatidylglycerophosphatase A
MFDKCVRLLSERGVEVADIAECVMYLQQKHHPEIGVEQVITIVEGILHKREVQHAILTGIALDIGAERHTLFDEELCDILNQDYSLYGIDEVLAYGICNLYGSIALTNYGYIDREKPCIIGRLNSHEGTQCNCFLDDIVGAIAASAASKIAHNIYSEVKP